MQLARPATLALAALLVACVGPPPIVSYSTHHLPEGALSRVAVVPFHPMPQLAGNTGAGIVGSIDAANLVSRLVSEAFAEAGIATVAPSDLVIGFEGRGQVLPRRDVAANAALAARDFGATAIVMGKVMRYREREGGAAGARKPASVLFETELHTAPEGKLIHAARFDQTQRALSAAPLLARQYPGRGTRWLTVAELARWGADEMVATLPEKLR